MIESPYASEYDEATRTLRLRGVVDELSGPTMRAELAQFSDQYRRPLTVDLSEVEYLLSAAVAVLAGSQHHAEEQGSTVELVAREGSLAQRILSICQVEHQAPPE